MRYEERIEEMRYYDDLSRYCTLHSGEQYDFEEGPKEEDKWVLTFWKDLGGDVA